MTNGEKQKAIDALKISVPIRAVTQEEFNNYIQTINQVMDWLEQEPTTKNDLGVDCISRFSAEQLVRKEFCNIPSKIYNKLMVELDDLPSVTPQESRWISVSERLPESSGNYLITYCYRTEIETQEAVYSEDEDEAKWFDITGVEITLAVIAWMPLPKAYSEVEE